MTLSERSPLPGWPYFIAALLAYMAFKRASNLPDENEDDYISEKYTGKIIGGRLIPVNRKGNIFEMVSSLARRLEKDADCHESGIHRIFTEPDRAIEDDEYIGLLSEVEEEG